MQLVVLLCHDILNVLGSRMSRKCFLCVSDKNKELFIFQIKSIQKELFEEKKGTKWHGLVNSLEVALFVLDCPVKFP